jgi:ATP-dependent HslUV protease subunit HslV
VAMAREWRSDRALRRLEALLTVADRDTSLLISGNGDVLEPEDGALAIGSGGNYALSAARALLAHSDLDAEAIARASLNIAADICVYTNHSLTVEVLGGSA